MQDKHLNITKYLDILCCPICYDGFCFSHKSLKCIKNHSFDISKNGYINFNIRKAYSDNKLKFFLNQRKIILSGLFDEVIEKLKYIVIKNIPAKSIILNACCGEGSLLHKLNLLSPEYNYMGIDISRTAIKLASKKFENILWFVSNIDNLNIKNNSIDLILNFLAPANYKEFSRILKNNGYFFKIIPLENHFIEIRDVLFYNRYRYYKGENVVEKYFSKRFKMNEVIEFLYKKKLSEGLRDHLLKTNRAFIGFQKNKIERLPDEVTIHLKLFIGTKK